MHPRRVPGGAHGSAALRRSEGFCVRSNATPPSGRLHAPPPLLWLICTIRHSVPFDGFGVRCGVPE